MHQVCENNVAYIERSRVMQFLVPEKNSIVKPSCIRLIICTSIFLKPILVCETCTPRGHISQGIAVLVPINFQIKGGGAVHCEMKH